MDYNQLSLACNKDLNPLLHSPSSSSSPSHHCDEGPEIRTGRLVDGKKLLLVEGDEICLTTDDVEGTQDMIHVNYAGILQTVSVGSKVLLDDGAISLSVLEIDHSRNLIKCRIENSGLLGQKKGVNLPNAKIDLPALSVKDKEDLRWGIRNDMDFVAASFVRKASDVATIRNFIEEVHSECNFPLHYPKMRIISKIENQEALENFDEILAASDGIMVARGDLGVEIPFSKVFAAQKMMVEKCKAVGKPVIVATQMLNSMEFNPRPTRAEVTDVGNAVVDGADAVMLSGETANGKYPVESVRAMRQIIEEAEAHIITAKVPTTPTSSHCLDGALSTNEAIAMSAVHTAVQIKANLIIVLTATGETSRYVAKYRPNAPVMSFCTSEKVGRQLQLHKGIFPVVLGDEETKYEDRPSAALRYAKRIGWISSGDVVIVINSQEDVLAHGDHHLAMKIVTAK